MVILKLTFGDEIKHKTYWKFNASLLKDRQYVEEVNNLIDSVVEEYTLDHHKQSTLRDVPGTDTDLTVCNKVFLDFMLMKIRSKTIAYATMKKKKSREAENKLIADIEQLEKHTPQSQTDVEQIRLKNQELFSLRQKRMEGVLLRSRARWVAEGEKITKYFCSLEKRNYVNKRMFKLVNADGSTTTDLEEINEKVNSFTKHYIKVEKLKNAKLQT